MEIITLFIHVIFVQLFTRLDLNVKCENSFVSFHFRYQPRVMGVVTCPLCGWRSEEIVATFGDAANTTLETHIRHAHPSPAQVPSMDPFQNIFAQMMGTMMPAMMQMGAMMGTMRLPPTMPVRQFLGY